MSERAHNPFKLFLELSFFAAMAILGVMLGYWVLDDELPYDYHRINARIEPQPAIPGERVTVTWPITVRRLCPGTVHRSLRDAVTDRPVAQYDPVPSSLTVSMGDKEIAKVFQLPAELPPLVKYEATVCFRCNPLQSILPICTRTPTLVFRVIPAPSR
jgi:hypothetical protein